MAMENNFSGAADNMCATATCSQEERSGITSN